MSASSANLFVADRSSLEVRLLGLVDFDAALFLQERLVYEISGRNDTFGSLLLCEHPPMVTVGREGSSGHILADARELAARQMEVRWLNRGGGCLVHAPGQLAVYPILPLDRLGVGLTEYRRRLEECVLGVCRELKLPAHRGDGAGVWTRCGRIAAIGGAVRSWVSYHGLFVNVAPSMELMRLVRSPDESDRVSSIAASRERVTSMHRVRESLIRNFAEQFGYGQHHLFTGHPLLTRTRRKIHVPA